MRTADITSHTILRVDPGDIMKGASFADRQDTLSSSSKPSYIQEQILISLADKEHMFSHF